MEAPGQLPGFLLNYCNFEEYSKYIFVVPDVPIGRITKSHEEVPFVVSRVISTLVVVTRAYISELGLHEPT